MTKSACRTLPMLLAAGLALAACGQSGPLYLPGNPSQIQVEDPAAEDESGVVETRDELDDETGERD